MKNKAKLINIKIPEYWIETAMDYHEFENIAYNLNRIGINIKYEEIGRFRDRPESRECYELYATYNYKAVFWIGKKPVDFIKENKIYY
jgi:hypothetical protein